MLGMGTFNLNNIYLKKSMNLCNLNTDAGLDYASHNKVTAFPIDFVVPSDFDLGGKRDGIIPRV